MKVTSLGFDPELGNKFAQDSSGFVIGLGKSSRTNSKKSNWSEGSQKWHDEMLAQTADKMHTRRGAWSWHWTWTWSLELTRQGNSLMCWIRLVEVPPQYLVKH